MNNTQFAIAVHLMAGLGANPGTCLPSRSLASSVNTSASFVRRILAKLSKAGLVRTTTGKSGACRLARDPGKISLLEIYRAVEAPKVFAIHAYAEKRDCVVSCGIKDALEKVRDSAQASMEARLAKTMLSEVLTGIGR